MRTAGEIKNAIVRLLENKEKTSRTNRFGDNKHEAIDLMVKVIEEDLSEDDIYDQYGNDDDDSYKLTSALNAREFLDGSTEIEDLLYPEK